MSKWTAESYLDYRVMLMAASLSGTGLNQSINQYSFIWWNIKTDTNTIAIYIAGQECSKAKYPECPAAYDSYRAKLLKYNQKPWLRIEIHKA